jgi:HEAT repeat protein
MKKSLVLTVGLLLATFSQASVDKFKDHIDMASNSKLNMNSRWTSLIKSADFATKDTYEDIRKFTTHKDWYMRNAALVALNKVDKEMALAEARKLVKDKALVVRSAAVEVIAKIMNEDNKRLLISELNQGYNYNKKSSLWIRRQILEKVATVANQGDRELFVKNLFDQDKKIAELSAKVLEKITGTKLESKKIVDSWRNHAKEQNWTVN